MSTIDFNDYITRYLTATVFGSVEDCLLFFSDDVEYHLIFATNLRVTGVGKDSIGEEVFVPWHANKKRKLEGNQIGFNILDHRTTDTANGTEVIIKWECWVLDDNNTKVTGNFVDKLLLNDKGLISKIEAEDDSEDFIASLQSVTL